VIVVSTRTAKLIFDGKAELAEGPVWHDAALWWVNINARTLNRLDVDNGCNVSRATGDFIGAAVPAVHGGWIVARGRDVTQLDWETGAIKPLAHLPADADPQLRFNDGKCDPRGRFHVGTMHRQLAPGRSAFYRLQKSRLIPLFEGVTVSNGLDWSPDQTRFYYADSSTSRVDVFDYDIETGGLSNRRALAEIPFDRGVPDGLCCDADGNLWVALWGGSGVECFDGRTGKSLEWIPVPVRQVSSCCFGGRNYDQLFITTAWEGCDDAARSADPLAGGIFTFEPGVCGQPPNLAQI
jgi:sugar lactone lactonase YvrE